MKASDIRIGNWVTTDLFPELPKEKNPYKEFQIVAMNIGFDNSSVFSDVNYYPKSVSLEKLKPIPLTPEWLERFGFNSELWINLNTHYFELIHTKENGVDWFYPVYAEINELSCEMEQQVSLNRIQYVHQLQNLYFALTGDELELK